MRSFRININVDDIEMFVQLANTPLSETFRFNLGFPFGSEKKEHK
jgi:hypothetical protein